METASSQCGCRRTPTADGSGAGEHDELFAHQLECFSPPSRRSQRRPRTAAVRHDCRRCRGFVGRARAAADFIADGQGDQEEINAAIQALPPAGGTVRTAGRDLRHRENRGNAGRCADRAQPRHAGRAGGCDEADSRRRAEHQRDPDHRLGRRARDGPRPVD